VKRKNKNVVANIFHGTFFTFIVSFCNKVLPPMVTLAPFSALPAPPHQHTTKAAEYRTIAASHSHTMQNDAAHTSHKMAHDNPLHKTLATTTINYTTINNLHASRTAFIITPQDYPRLPPDIKARVDAAHGMIKEYVRHSGYGSEEIQTWHVHIDSEGDEFLDVVIAPSDSRCNNTDLLNYQRAYLARKRGMHQYATRLQNNEVNMKRDILNMGCIVGRDVIVTMIRKLSEATQSRKEQVLKNMEWKYVQYRPVLFDAFNNWALDRVFLPGDDKGTVMGKGVFIDYNIYQRQMMKCVDNCGMMVFCNTKQPDGTILHLTPSYLEEQIEAQHEIRIVLFNAFYKISQINEKRGMSMAGELNGMSRMVDGSGRDAWTAVVVDVEETDVIAEEGVADAMLRMRENVAVEMEVDKRVNFEVDKNVGEEVELRVSECVINKKRPLDETGAFFDMSERPVKRVSI
jgi:hypothetical protein